MATAKQKAAARKNLEKARAASARKRKANAKGAKAADGLPVGGMTMKQVMAETGMSAAQMARFAREARNMDAVAGKKAKKKSSRKKRKA